MPYEVKGPEAVEDGPHTAQLVAIEEIDHPNFGRRIKWNFVLPEADGFEVSRFTSEKFTDSSKATETAAALLGRKLERGVTFDKEDLIGKTCVLWLGIGEKGYNTVEKAVAAPRKRPAPPRDLIYDDDAGES